MVCEAQKAKHTTQHTNAFSSLFIGMVCEADCIQLPHRNASFLSVPSLSGWCVKLTAPQTESPAPTSLSVPSLSGWCVKLATARQTLKQEVAFSSLFIGMVCEAKTQVLAARAYRSLSVPSLSGWCVKQIRRAMRLDAAISLSVPSLSGWCVKLSRQTIAPF